MSCKIARAKTNHITRSDGHHPSRGPRNERATIKTFTLWALAVLLGAAAGPALAQQCPGDSGVTGNVADVECRSFITRDGFTQMADGTDLYIFGFADVTDGADPMAAPVSFPGPTVVVDEGDQLYLSLTSLSYTTRRPDIFPAQTLHWSGYQEATPVFAGEPKTSFAVPPNRTMTYFFQVNQPGTSTYRSLADADLNLQMGLLGTVVVRAAQDRLPDGFPLGPGVHRAGDRYAYDDGDGSTRYDVDYTVQLGSFDAVFHDLVALVQVPEAAVDAFGLVNGRGYPDTGSLGPPEPLPPPNQQCPGMTAVAGQRILLRIANLSTTRAFTLASLGLPLRVVGRDARLLRGPTGIDLSYPASAITLDCGETADAIVDTTGVTPGSYFLYTTNLRFLTNTVLTRYPSSSATYLQDNPATALGGMMTEIVICPAS